jgi:hypothetical protein
VIAAIGSDGTRLVVWGIGATETEATEDSIGYGGPEEQPGRLTFAEINEEQRANIVAGMVACGELGIRGLDRLAREVASP